MKEHEFSHTLVADVVIIGGGPAGLSVAYYLQKSSVDYVVLESEAVGESWRRMPDSLHLVSPDWTNVLPGSVFNVRFADFWKKSSAKAYAKYLEKYTAENGINVRENARVKSVALGGNGEHYTVNTDNISIRTRVVVCATGYYSNPYRPYDSFETDNSVPVIHASEYRNSNTLIKEYGEIRNILVVGKRVTAGQLITEFVEHGFSVDLSARSPVAYRRLTKAVRVKYFVYFFWEAIRIRFQPNLKAESFPGMDPGKSADLLEQEVVKIHPPIKQIHDGNVLFTNGVQKRVDMIIMATGYKPNLYYLSSLIDTRNRKYPDIEYLESTCHKGILFIGFDQLVNFRSRYLRGIRSDSRVVAGKVKEILNEKSTIGESTKDSV